MKFYLARQPIFDRDRLLVGYELLHRGSERNEKDDTDGDAATSQVITASSMSLDIASVARGKPAYINFTRHLLVQGIATLLPPKAVVVEILEDIEPDEEVVDACKALKKKGYQIALDDFRYEDYWLPLLEIADIVKIDFRVGDPAEQAAKVLAVGNPKLKLLAEKVETYEEFQLALDCGFHLFQGYFFAKPEVFSGKTIRELKANCLELVAEVSQAEPDMDRVEAVLRRDPGLAYKLMKYINSPYFGWRSEIKSVRHGLVLMGRLEFRRWSTVVALSSVGSDKPMELMVLAVTRAWFLHNLAESLGRAAQQEELFLLGLFSLLDAMTDHPLPQVLGEVPVSAAIRDALLENTGPLAPMLDLCVALEQADWDTVVERCEWLGINDEAGAIYVKAVESTTELFQHIGMKEEQLRAKKRKEAKGRSGRKVTRSRRLKKAS